jgi:nicotinamide mononucleotide transporter
MEIVSAVLVLVSVYLSTRENIWAWPTAIVAVILFGAVLWQQRLYAGVGLQVCFVVISGYGWYHWLFGGALHNELKVSRITPATAAGVLAAWVAGWLLYGWAVVTFMTDPALPWFDAALSAASLLAQWMLSRKILENWLVWVTVNVCYVGLFISQGLPVYAGLYVILFFLATKGYLDWRRSWREHPAPTSVPPNLTP